VIIALRGFLHLWKSREEKELVAGAAGEGKAVLLRKVVRGPHLDSQVTAGESFIKLSPVQRTSSSLGALVQYSLSHRSVTGLGLVSIFTAAFARHAWTPGFPG
jgi:hypothetical protein